MISFLQALRELSVSRKISHTSHFDIFDKLSRISIEMENFFSEAWFEGANAK